MSSQVEEKATCTKNWNNVGSGYIQEVYQSNKRNYSALTLRLHSTLKDHFSMRLLNSSN